MNCILCNSKMTESFDFPECRLCGLSYFKKDNYYFGYCVKDGITDSMAINAEYLYLNIEADSNQIKFYNWRTPPIFFTIKSPTLESINKLIKKVFKMKAYT